MRIMPRLGLVDCDKITIYQVFSGGEHSKVDKITVDSQGELSEWPKDFFDQQLVDMDILMSGKDV
jgi:predicted ATPase